MLSITRKQSPDQTQEDGQQWKFFFHSCCILIDILNLVEQVGMYFAQKGSQMDDASQRKFFFILFGMEGVNIVRWISTDYLFNAIISFVTEIGELICYLSFLERSTAVKAVSAVAFGVQVLLHGLGFYVLWKFDKRYKGCTCCRWDNCCSFVCTRKRTCKMFGFVVYYVFMFGLINSISILTLFFNTESLFRQTLYEVSLTISLFLASSCIDSVIDIADSFIRCCKNSVSQANQARKQLDSDRWRKKKHGVERYWTYLLSFIFSIDIIYMSLLSLVLTGLEWIRKDHAWSSYERKAHLAIIILSIFILLLSPFLIGLLCCCYAARCCGKINQVAVEP